MTECPFCHQDPGEGPRCEQCGEMLYRYAVDEEPDPESPAEDDDTFREMAFGGSWNDDPQPPSESRAADSYAADPFADGPSDPNPAGTSWDTPVPPWDSGEVGSGPTLNVPRTPLPSDSIGTKTKQGPNGCAIAAIVVGVLIVVVLGALFFIGRAFIEEAGEQFGIENLEDLSTIAFTSEAIDWEQVRVGDCINYVDPISQDGESLVSTLERVDCFTLHEAEVFAMVDLDDGSWPGSEVAYSVGSDICLDRFEGYVGIDYFDSLYFYEVYTPTPDSWEFGDRTVVCTVFNSDGPIDKPLRNVRE